MLNCHLVQLIINKLIFIFCIRLTFFNFFLSVVFSADISILKNIWWSLILCYPVNSWFIKKAYWLFFVGPINKYYKDTFVVNFFLNKDAVRSIKLPLKYKDSAGYLKVYNGVHQIFLSSQVKRSVIAYTSCFSN